MKVHIGPYPKGEKERKISIKIDPYDTWSLDYTLSLLAVPLLKQLKETKHGAPNVDDEDVPEHLRSTAAPPVEEHGVDENYFLRWDWVLDEMIWAHEQIVKDDESQFFDHSEVDESKNFFDQFDKVKVDKAGLKAYNERINNGVRLFGKYYRGLWD